MQSKPFRRRSPLQVLPRRATLRDIGWSCVFTTAWAALGAACGPTPEPLGPAPGHSDRPRGGPLVPATSSADAGPILWERWAEVAAYRVAIARTPSQHLAADHEGEVLAS